MKNFLENCTVIKSKKAQQFIDRYEHSVKKYGYRDLENCYEDCSRAKWRARNEIARECHINGGHGFTITGYSMQTFSCRYIMEIGGKTWLIYDTQSNKYAIEY